MSTAASGTTTMAREMTAKLDDAIAALTRFDGKRLETLVEEMSATLAGGELKAMLALNKKMREQEWNEVAARHRLLGRLIESTGLNLNVLENLHRRNRMGEDQWVR